MSSGQLLGQVDRLADRLPVLARQADDEVAPGLDPVLVAEVDRPDRVLDLGVLLDVVEHLLRARLDAEGDQPAAGLLHLHHHLLVDACPRGCCRSSAPSARAG